MPKLATREAIRARRKAHPDAGRHVPVQAYPSSVEREYERILTSLVREMSRGVVEQVIAAYAPTVRRDAADETVGRAIADIEAEVYKTVSNSKARLLAQGVGRRTNRFVKTAVGAQVKAVIGVDPLATVALEPGAVAVALDAFAARNVDLITSIPRTYFGQIHALTRDANERGVRPETLARELQERTGVAASRARLIARDQIGKLQGQLTELRQRSIGISGYTWRTSLDERVRPEHQALEGQHFDWNSPPDVGHPGDDIQCRCRAEPDFEGLFD